MELTNFRDLPEVDQLAAFEKLQSGEQLYGLSPDDDTHVKFAVMMALDGAKKLYSPDYNLSFIIEIGYDERGLFVSYPITKADIEDNFI